MPARPMADQQIVREYLYGLEAVILGEGAERSAGKAVIVREWHGEGGIRTRGTVSRTHAFQACSLGHSDTSPNRSGPGRLRSDSLGSAAPHSRTSTTCRATSAQTDAGVSGNQARVHFYGIRFADERQAPWPPDARARQGGGGQRFDNRHGIRSHSCYAVAGRAAGQAHAKNRRLGTRLRKCGY
jgi:hypothetical protein